MVVQETQDFPVTWSDSDAASRTWIHDGEHHPEPIPPMTQDWLRIAAADMGFEMQFPNGYVFMGLPDAPPPAQSPSGDAWSLWEKEYVPEVRRIDTTIRSGPYAAMTAVELAEALPDLFRSVGEAFAYSMRIGPAMLHSAVELTRFCEEELGSDGTRLAGTLLRRQANASAASAAALARLVEAAAASPPVATALRLGQLEDIGALEGGAGFLRELWAFLEQYGRRAESWTILHKPTWVEDISVPLGIVGRYLDGDEPAGSGGFERATEQQARAQREVESRLEGEKLSRFRALHEAARDYLALSESRAFWQLQGNASIRVPLLALGRKLQVAGVIEEPYDIFFLTLEEAEASAAEPAPMAHVVEERRHDLERYRRLRPPPFIGKPPVAADEGEEGWLALRLRTGAAESEDRTIRGQGASQGVARGVARIVSAPDEFARLQAGDILVCRSTSPVWTPLFGIAAGVVTDSGGILSHSAICAREYGIPCVVGTQVGTSTIPDGDLISIDGAEGTVTIGD